MLNENPIILFDGVCNLCNDTVNFIMKRDRKKQFRFVALQSEAGKFLKEKFDIPSSTDSVILIFQNQIVTESDAAIKIAWLLPFPWKLAVVFNFIPKKIRDKMYRWVAKNRYKWFGKININDSFFDSFKEDYFRFEKWFLKKSDEIAYVTINNGRILSFLYLKVEDQTENYSDITPNFHPLRRLKIGTFKVISNGVRLGERFLKIIFDNAIQYQVDEIYVTIFNKRNEQKRLISLLQDWGFALHGIKNSDNGDELVYKRDFKPSFNKENPKFSFPYISKSTNIFMIPIYPDYHTELLPDSILTTESPYDFIENQPHRNAISKVYISRSIERNINKGDIIIFYRTAAGGRSAYYSSVITTIAIAEDKIENILDENDFILKCRKRSIFSDKELKEFWNYNPRYRPFIINL